MKLTNEDHDILRDLASFEDKADLMFEVERLITEALAVMAERCAVVVEVFAGLSVEDKKVLCWKVAKAIRALSPDPDFLARKMAEARLATFQEVKAFISAANHPAASGFVEREIAELEREVAAMKEGK